MTLSSSDRIIVALDVPALNDAVSLVKQLSGLVGAFKIGLELITSAGAPNVVNAIHEAGGKVFYDGKFCDIPNTVRRATAAAASLGVFMLDVHASAGPASIAAAVQARGNALVVAVTVLTSMDDDTAKKVFGTPASKKVLELARMAKDAGADGVVCSGEELQQIRADPYLEDLLTVVPGVRPAWASAGDQARVMTPAEAVRSGADYLVIGRPILNPPASIGSPRDAARIIAEEIASV